MRHLAKALDDTQSTTRELPAPTITLSDAAMQHYAEVMRSIPTSEHHSPVLRAIAATMAQAMCEVEDASAILDAQGLVLSTPSGKKVHPAVGVRDAASRRLAALAARLKALPQADARELARAARAENNARANIADDDDLLAQPEWR